MEVRKEYADVTCDPETGAHIPSRPDGVKLTPKSAGDLYAKDDTARLLLVEARNKAAAIHDDHRLSVDGKRYEVMAALDDSFREHFKDMGRRLNGAKAELRIREKAMDASDADPVAEHRRAEIRDHLAKQKNEDRMKLIEKVINDGNDVETLRALAQTPAVRDDVLSSNPHLKQRERARAALRRAVEPEKAAEHESLSVAVAHFEKVLVGAGAFLDELSAADEPGIAAIFARAEKAASYAAAVAAVREGKRPAATGRAPRSRSQMTVAQKSAFIREKGLEAFKNLPERPATSDAGR